MTKTLIQKTAAVVTSSALFMSAVTPAFATSALTGNSMTGADSSNESKVEVVQETAVVQDNKANIDNNINFKANTGNNENSKNTGDSMTGTGDVAIGTAISNKANSNFSNISPCGGCDTHIEVGNMKTGYGSENESEVVLNKNNQLFQNNSAYVNNDVNVKADTGNNKANKNLYGSYINSGDIEATSIIDNAVNENVAAMSGGHGNGSNYISGNSETGADSDNDSSIKSIFSNIVDQANKAKINNNADLKLNTGKNKGNKNTGETYIETGDIATGVAFGNSANFNFAAMSGACCDIYVEDGNMKTGADSENESETVLKTLLQAFQTNYGKANNDVNGHVDTGHNQANKNNDPGIYTGEIEGVVQVETDSMNENVLGDIDVPDFVQIGGNQNGNSALWGYLFGMNS